MRSVICVVLVCIPLHVAVASQASSLQERPKTDPPEKLIFEAIDRDNAAMVSSLLKQHPQARGARNMHHETPLLYALSRQHGQSVHALINEGLVRVKQSLATLGRSEMQDPAFKETFFRFFLAFLAAVHAQCVYHASLLAHRYGKKEQVLRSMLKRCLLVYAGTYLCRRFFPDDVLEYGVLPAGGFQRAFVDAVERSMEKLLPLLVPLAQKLMVWHMPDLYLSDKHNTNPLMAAARAGAETVVSVILALGVDVDAGNAYGMNPVLYAATHGHARVVNLLLDAGADPDVCDTLGTSPLAIALASGARSCAELLLHAGAKTTTRDKHETGSVMAALHGIYKVQQQRGAKRGYGLQLVRRLLAGDAYPQSDMPDCTGLTPLMLATRMQRRDIMRELILNGVQVDRRDSTGWHALMHAVNEGFVAGVDLLLARGSQIALTNEAQETVLSIALLDGNILLVQRLLLAGAFLQEEEKKKMRSFLVQVCYDILSQYWLPYSARAWTQACRRERQGAAVQQPTDAFLRTALLNATVLDDRRTADFLLMHQAPDFPERAAIALMARSGGTHA